MAKMKDAENSYTIKIIRVSSNRRTKQENITGGMLGSTNNSLNIMQKAAS